MSGREGGALSSLPLGWTLRPNLESTACVAGVASRVGAVAAVGLGALHVCALRVCVLCACVRAYGVLVATCGSVRTGVLVGRTCITFETSLRIHRDSRVSACLMLGT